MALSPELLLVGAVAAVGVLHTMVPDHWVPITLIARQQGWSKTQTARAALLAGTGHVLSTLAIAAVVWIAGIAVARKFGSWVDTIASVALVLFGSWIAISALRDLRRGDGHHVHGHGHSHGHSHLFPALGEADAVHGPERQRFETHDGPIDLSIFETDMPPHFRITGAGLEPASLETVRPDGARQTFLFARRGDYWETTESIPEPHGFDVTLTVGQGDHQHTYAAAFAEHEHGHDHVGHDHSTKPKTRKRTALLLILGSSPMVEGIPAFFAASRYGVGLIIVMSLVFAATTIVTYVVLCVGSVAGLERVSLGPIERYGEVLSGAFIALIGVAFWLWPLL
ncbi:MAG TPA: hypothetical protein VIJ94_04955 [Caulobacteraceae bacterium]